MTKSADNLYLLTYLDVMDRLDILLLEIRHVQLSIIYNLRTPELYLPLRFEEQYLFGGNWGGKDCPLTKSSSSYDDVAIVRDWTIRYPTPKEAVKFYMGKLSEDNRTAETNKIKATLKETIGLIWLGDNWVKGQRLQYHILFALQVLKQQIFRDKITLTRGALQANLRMSEKKQSQLSKAAFMVLRQGVTHRMIGYVNSLKNHKQYISKSNDFDEQRRNTGTIERRRELGIYRDFLSNRTRDIQRDILHLFSGLKLEGLNTQLIFHGWSEQTRVSNHYLHDDVNELYLEYNKEDQYDREKVPVHDIGYINTSFWTPDRPDLQPIIAGKVAKTIIDNALNSLDDVRLSNSTDEFTALIINLKKVLGGYLDELTQYSFNCQHELICDVAGDIVAASTKGVGYLYAMFLLRVGDGLHQQLYVGNEIKLDMAYMLEQGVADFSHSLYWYVRIKLCVAWLKKINPYDSMNKLDQMVVDGIEQVVDELIDFLYINSPEYRKSNLLSIKEITENLLKVLAAKKHSGLIKKVHNWRVLRDNDEWGYKGKADNGVEGKKKYSRTTRKLDLRLQNYLFRELLKKKTGRNKPLRESSKKKYKDFKALNDAFEKVYRIGLKNINIPKEVDKTYCQPKGLFEYMFDIPYQSSMIRSIDFLHRNYTSVPLKEFFADIHDDIELGRSLFAFALEFHTREKESPEQRLSLCINQITFAYERLKSEDFKKDLRDWLSEEESISKKQRGSLKKYLEENIVDKIEFFKKKISSIGALTINATFSSIPIDQVETSRRMEFLAGCKIRELTEILSSYAGKDGKKGAEEDYELFSPLLEFISIRRSGDESYKDLHLRYYNRMLASMGDICEKDKMSLEDSKKSNPQLQKCLPRSVPTLMLQRLLMTNPYPVPDPQAIKQDSGGSIAKSNVVPKQNRKSFLSYFSEFLWLDDQSSDENYSRSFHWLSLGRYDSIVVSPVRQPCKCKLPYFKDSSTKGEVSKESYYPFTLRKEVALLVWLTKGNRTELGFDEEDKSEDKSGKITHCGEKIFAMLSVSLQRRGMRLDFIYRLIRALNGDTETEKSGLEKKANALKKAGVDFHVFLTDGWGDLLFVFIRKDEVLGEKQLDQLVEFQQAVNEDFMVDRTEMMFSPQCVNVALASGGLYNVRIQVTLMEDRWLEKGVSLLKEQVRALNRPENKPAFIAELSAKYLASQNAVKLNITALSQDELVQGDKDGKPILVKNCYYEIVKWISDVQVGNNPPMKDRLERIETSIAKNIMEDR